VHPPSDADDLTIATGGEPGCQCGQGPKTGQHNGQGGGLQGVIGAVVGVVQGVVNAITGLF
jgi:hypothetical protein